MTVEFETAAAFDAWMDESESVAEPDSAASDDDDPDPITGEEWEEWIRSRYIEYGLEYSESIPDEGDHDLPAPLDIAAGVANEPDPRDEAIGEDIVAEVSVNVAEADHAEIDDPDPATADEWDAWIRAQGAAQELDCTRNLPSGGDHGYALPRSALPQAAILHGVFHDHNGTEPVAAEFDAGSFEGDSVAEIGTASSDDDDPDPINGAEWEEWIRSRYIEYGLEYSESIPDEIGHDLVAEVSVPEISVAEAVCAGVEGPEPATADDSSESILALAAVHESDCSRNLPSEGDHGYALPRRTPVTTRER